MTLESFWRWKSSPPLVLSWRGGGAGGVATFTANPYAPRKERLSLTTKAPGSLSFRTAMAVHTLG